MIKVLLLHRPFWHGWRAIDCLNDAIALEALLGEGNCVLSVWNGLNTLFVLKLLFAAFVDQALHGTLFLVTYSSWIGFRPIGLLLRYEWGTVLVRNGDQLLPSRLGGGKFGVVTVHIRPGLLVTESTTVSYCLASLLSWKDIEATVGPRWLLAGEGWLLPKIHALVLGGVLGVWWIASSLGVVPVVQEVFVVFDSREIPDVVRFRLIFHNIFELLLCLSSINKS